MRGLWLTQAVYDAILEHAYAELPMEAVGLLGGRADDRVTKQIALLNLAGFGSFFADPHSQFKAFKSFEREGLRPVAVYHSHPGGGIGLSAEDVVFARQLPYTQVVVALARPGKPGCDVAAYAITGGTPRRIPLNISP